MAYCSASDVFAYGDFESDTDDFVLINTLIAAAEKVIDNYVGRTFEAASDLRYFDAGEDVASNTLWFDEVAQSITHVGNGDGTSDIGSDNWVTEPRNSKPYYGVTLVANSSVSWTYDSNPENAIVIDAVWGYATSAPADIKHACIRLVNWMYKQRESSADLDRPLLTGEGVLVMPSRMPQDVLSILDFYKEMELLDV